MQYLDETSNNIVIIFVHKIHKIAAGNDIFILIVIDRTLLFETIGIGVLARSAS